MNYVQIVGNYIPKYFKAIEIENEGIFTDGKIFKELSKLVNNCCDFFEKKETPVFDIDNKKYQIIITSKYITFTYHQFNIKLKNIETSEEKNIYILEKSSCHLK